MSKSKQTMHLAPASDDALIEAIPQLVWTVRPDGQLEYINQRAREYTGLTEEQFQSDRWTPYQFIHPDDWESHRANFQRALETAGIFEHEERLRQGQTGRYRWFLSRAEPLRNEAGQIVRWVGTSTDIEHQKRIEQALQEGQERADALMKSRIIGIFISESDQIVEACDTFLRMTGYSREDLCAGHMNWLHMTPPEDLAQALQAHQELAVQQSMTPYEQECLCKGGSRLPVLVGGVLLQHSSLRVLKFVLDNSARKALEQRKDNFISMASHELRTPLTAVKLQIQLVRKRFAKTFQHEVATALCRMESQVNTLTRLVEELLDVSKIQAGRLEYVWETVDLDALLREIADTMQQSHSNHTLVVRSMVGTSLIGDRDRLGQVFTNLISNAIKYSPDAETVEIDLFTSQDAVTIRVRDHGLGIPREQRDQIFERFYRTAGPSYRTIPGLGMGLYIVAEIIERHGGTITVDSDVGKGSTFTVVLPKSREV